MIFIKLMISNRNNLLLKKLCYFKCIIADTGHINFGILNVT